MFTGIVESIGEIQQLENSQSNLILKIKSPISNELKIDQSVAHNGVCLTVVELEEGAHTVVAIKETLDKTTLSALAVGDVLNLERCMKADGRFDGHMVQGHVDTVAQLRSVQDEKGSYRLCFSYEDPQHITVEKGSICINGISLTVINSKENEFCVAIIPYTWQETNLHRLKPGDWVNVEFDIIGKYIQKIMNFKKG